MFIVMHCGGMPFNGATIETKSLGGSETAAFYLSKELAKRGHRVTLFTNHPEEGEWGGVQYRFAGQQTEQTPLGDRYHTYAVATPHDVNITQRHPNAFAIPVAAKVRAWWLHDVPREDYAPAARGNMLTCDLIFAVSEWHREQIIEKWGINPANVVSIENGVDLELFNIGDRGSRAAMTVAADGHSQRLLYSSRPERGLETLVQEGGVMERLAAKGSDAHLYVCGYDNVTPPMAKYYAWLDARCDALPNVTRLGALTKQELAEVMRQCDLLTYPTVFKETSCITAMEAMAAQLPILSSALGALPETCRDSAAILLPLVDATRPRPGAMEAGDMSKEVDIDAFVEMVIGFGSASAGERQKMRDEQAAAARRHTWDLVAERADNALADVFARVASRPAISRHLMRNSDIYALQECVERTDFGRSVDGITARTLAELEECYSFIAEPEWSEHYKAYYEYEKNRGVDYGPENLDNNHRFEYVSSLVGGLPAGSRVLDYGCAHGHYTINLAKRFPDLQFVGVDITPSNVEKARAWAESEGVENVAFVVGKVLDGRLVDETCGDDPLAGETFDMAIAAEVLEHVADPQHHVDTLHKYLKPEGGMCITVPYGPWEALGYEQHWPWRAHVHHFERGDLLDMFGHFPGFRVTVISSGRSPQGEPLGSYVAIWGNPGEIHPKPIDYARKLSELAPRQTLSVCMIVKDAEETIAEAIKSVAGIADEFIFGIDRSTTDGTEAAIKRAHERYCPHVALELAYIDGPLEMGFDEARNATIERASGDWVLWMDADERIHQASNLLPFLRHNGYDAYALPHHHFSMEPAGLLKTDYPCRVFRNHKGITFRGVVHEHPETGLNEGIKYTAVLDNVAVAHYGYTDEFTRRLRFNRNYPLMVRDREKYPDRHLGKFLWIRDLFQVSRYELENGSLFTDEMINRAFEGVELWEDLVRNAPLRLALESLEWYSGLCEILGGGVSYSLVVRGKSQELTAGGTFRDERHANMLAARMMKEA